MHAHETAVQQSTVRLPYFEADVQALTVVDGGVFIPVIVLCQLLGLRADTRIRRWRKTFLWANARKLPLRTPNRGLRLVWCLPVGALPFWLASFDWRHVSPERRPQLKCAMDAWTLAAERAYREMLNRSRHLRRLLFAVLIMYADAETACSRFALHQQAQLDVLASLRLEQLMSQGQALIGEATSLARRMLRAQETIPVVDAVEIELGGTAMKTLSLPLWSMVPPEEYTQLLDFLRELTVWRHTMATFFRGAAPS